jgi:hypothetical protein
MSVKDNNSILEEVLSTLYKPQMIEYMLAHPELFDDAMELALSDKQPYAWRAAWLLTDIVNNRDTRLQKYIPQIIEAIQTKKKDGHQRELLHLVISQELDDEQEGMLFDLCMNLWESIGKQPSVRYTAFRYIAGLVKKYPELVHELELITSEEYLESLSPGVKNAVLRTKKEIGKK